MDIASNNQCYRLSPPGVHITEDGDKLEDNKDRKGTGEDTNPGKCNLICPE